jgi:large repetitive protein
MRNKANSQGALSRLMDWAGLSRQIRWLALALVLSAGAGQAWAQAQCTVKNNPPARIQHDLTTSYCELCGFGYVSIVITNPFQGATMVNMGVVENLGSSGLTYAPAAPTPVRYSINGGPLINGPAPAVSGANGSVLTWAAGAFPDLAAVNGNNSFGTLTITFAVTRAGALTQEGLVSANRQIQATLSYSTNPVCTVTSPVGTGLNTLPLREPLPVISKLGRNVDANQGTGSYSGTVYGNINDDVIWRVRVTNNGLAAMQDMRISDAMQTGGMNIHYACPSEASATTAAGNLNAIVTGGTPPPPPPGCVVASNTIGTFVVNNPFGNPNNDSPDRVDVPANGTSDVFLVGKLASSCSPNTTNTASNLQWGCTVEAPPGGIAQTSTGVTPANAVATLSDLVVPSGLNVQRQLRGINTAQPVGSRGLMTITIRNTTGGTIKNINLRDVLPPEYVVDPTFPPTLNTVGAYGNYAGMTDRITWTNPVPGTFPLSSTNPADPLGNTQPEFRLWSSTTHPSYPDQVNMVRHNDVVTINFRVVLIRSSSYDRVAHLDVTPEVTTDGTDPSNQTTLNNSLFLTYEDFCNPGVVRNAPTYPYNDTFPANPEDLDIATGANIYILTNDPAQPLTLPVVVRNAGGHDARDYQVFVSFGATMQVQSAPAGCSAVTLSGSPPQPAPWRTWILPSSIPTTATVYRCVPGGALPNPMAPGASTTLNFSVIKTSDPARIALDDLSFRADVVGEITLFNTTPLWFPTPIVRADGQTDRANNYSLDGVRARVVGFNLIKNRQGNCTENNPPPTSPDSQVQIGEECTYNIQSGGWFGFQTPGFTYIAVQNIRVVDQLPAGQGYISSTDPALTSTPLVRQFALSAVTNPPLSALDEGSIAWTFNPVAPLSNRISQRDEWFRVDATTRFLNSPLNASAAPNQQAAISSNVLNSTFEAVFASGAVEQIFTLGASTIGYPLPPIRTVNQTVTEPLVTVVKTVCNETLYGPGPTCSNFVPLAADGDTFDTYIYRVVVSNAATGGGVARAPAYEVSARDVLDPSDLMRVVPFAADGLDNDGDGLIDAADANGEGSISDNTVNNGNPAQITFSHTNSNALLRINPGATVTLYYRVDPDITVQAGQSLVNSVTASYDTLAGPSGAQTVAPSPSGTVGGARTYTSPASTATVRMLLPTVQPKRIVALSQPNHGTVVTPPAAQPVSVGEEIRYELRAILPIAELRNFVIRDQLPVGVRCAQAPAVDLGPAGPHAIAGFFPGGVITPTCTDTLVEWNFGTQALTNGANISFYDFAVNFVGRVENTANTNDGNVLANGTAPSVVTASYTNSLNTLVTLPIGSVSVQVQEPRIALTQSIAPAIADAADQLTVTVTATNTGTATAYNLRVLNDLTTLGKLSYVGSGIGGLDPPDVVDVATLGANRPIFIWNPSNPRYAIPPGVSRSFTFRVSVNIGVQPLEVIASTLQAKWDSLPGRGTALNTTGQIGVDGSATGQRTGTLPNSGGQPNDYEASVSASFSVPAVTMSKTDLTPAVVPTIGAYKNFQVDINLPEGTTQNLLLTDNLADLTPGSVSYLLANNAAFDITYSFQGIASINGLAPVEAAFNAFPADNTTGNAVWNIGTVVTASENDPTTTAIAPRIRINYFARINNTLAVNTGSTLRNSATANYRNGATGATMTLNATTPQVTVVEPMLTLAKAMSNITSPGLPPNGGDVLEYTLTLFNTGNSTAHDINLVDTLSPLLTFQGAFTPTATIAGVPVAGFVPTPGAAPAGPLVWGRGNGDASLDLPAGQTLLLRYRTIILAAQPNASIGNSVTADWTSLDGASPFERTGAGCPAFTAPNRYCVGPVLTTAIVPDLNAIAKAVVADSYAVAGLSTATDAVLRVGDTVTFRLNVSIQEGRTRNVVVTDVLPAGMAFDAIVSINGVAVAPYAAPLAGPGSNFSYSLLGIPSAGQVGAVTWNFGTVDNDAAGDPTTDILAIEYRVRVVPNVLSQVASTTLTNAARLNYIDANGNAPPVLPRLNSSATVTVLQPIVSALTKTDRTPRASGVTINPTVDTMLFRLSACNSGLAPAYSLLLTDTLATQFNNASIVAPSSPLKLEPDVTVNGVLANSGTDYVYTPPPVDAGSFSVALNQGVNPGQCVTVDFNIGFDAIAPNQAWNNTLNLSSYWSLPASSGQQYAPVGPVLFGMNNASPLSPPTKTLLSSTGSVAGEVTIGDELVYRITVPSTPVAGTLHDVRILDALNPALELVSASATINSVTVSVPNAGTPSNLILTVGPVANQAVIDLRVRVANNAAAVAGTLLDNTASFTYALVPNGVPIAGGSASTLPAEQRKIVEPRLGLTKGVVNVTVPGAPPKAGDVLRYSLTLTASGGAGANDFSNAYDVSLRDTLSLGLAYQGNPTVTGAGNTIVAPTVLSGDGITTPQVLNWSLGAGSNIDIPEGTTVSVTYEVVVLSSVQANQALSNSAVAQWTGLNGANAFERTGSGTPAVNNYFTAPAVTTLTTLDTTALTKTRLTDTYGAGDALVRIGDVVEFELRMRLPEGTTPNAVLSDVLPQGLRFETVVSVNGLTSAPYGNAVPFSHSALAAPAVTGNPATGPSTVTWNLGNIVNAGNNNPADDVFIIVYRARVLEGALAQGGGAAQTLSNNATLAYTTASGAASRTGSQSLTVQQPMLSVTKTSLPATGSTIAPNDLITYTVEIRNTGTAPAYDMQLRDVLPLGLRNGTTPLTVQSMSFVVAGTALLPLAPSYTAATGVALWNFDTSAANAYTLPAGETLRIVYRVQADAGLGAGLSMSNQAQVQSYCSFDNNAVPSLGSGSTIVSGVRQCYGPSNTAATTLVTPAPNPLAKAITQPTATIGVPFRYRITIPATPQAAALFDVQVLDNLGTSAADLIYVGVTPVSGPAWTPVISGAPKNLVISGSGTGLDIAAGQQAVFDVTVVLNDSATNVTGLSFQNTASYTYNQIDGLANPVPGGAATSPAMTVVGPDSVTLQKSGPATMRAGVPGNFTLNVQNTGTAAAWDLTIVDVLPDPTPGGMCSVAPTVTAAQVFRADGTTPAGPLLVAGTDYSASFAPAPVCTLTLTMRTAAGAIAPTDRLIVSYQAALDADTVSGSVLTNRAAATQWFSADTPANAATGTIRTYSRTLTDGTPGVLDFQDAHAVLTEAPVLEFRKSVINATTGQNPGSSARPGDLLRYTVTVRNVGPLAVSGATLTDELDRLNATAYFAAGSLQLVSAPAGATSNTNANGGARGSGLLDVRGLNLAAAGSAGDTLTVVYEARLVPVIASGSSVLNQAQLASATSPTFNSDDPNVNGPDNPAVIGDEDPTRTTIASAPLWQVRKTSLDITGDPATLRPGDRLRYTLTVKNIGTENAVGVLLRDAVPPNTTYVPGSTTLNGVALPDVAGALPLQAGMPVNAPEDATPGAMRADASATPNNVATLVFDVQVDAGVLDGTLISNQGFVTGSGTGSGAFAEMPSDDPRTPFVGDPTVNIVGAFPLLSARKTVALVVDTNADGVLDPLETIRYTIRIDNLSDLAATGVVLTDPVPANTTYVADTVTLNGAPVAQPDGGVSPLILGVPVNSPSSAAGTLAPRSSATIVFDVRVNAGVAAGTVISNQGTVVGTALPDQLTDADGNSANGYQPTTIVVGSAQQVFIAKAVRVVGGGPALPDSLLEYSVTATNTGAIPATNVVLTDDLGTLPLATQVAYVAGSALLNGLPAGVSLSGALLRADFAATYGNLAPGASAELRFHVRIAPGLPDGTLITNTAQVAWNTPALTASASITIAVGGVVGTASLNGRAWHDANFNRLVDTGELLLQGWTVDVLRDNVLLGALTIDANGRFGINGLVPSATPADQFSLRFRAPGSGATTAALGRTDSAFTNGMQVIGGIVAPSGSNLQNLNLPLQPNGATYDSIVRAPVAGATLHLLRAGSSLPLPSGCFDDPLQQGQVTLASGQYKFDLNFSDPACPAGGAYFIRATPPTVAFMPGESRVIPPLSNPATASFSVPACMGTAADAVPATSAHCEAQASELAPGVAVPAGSPGTSHYLNLTLNSGAMPGTSQIFNNHIAIDPLLSNAVSISKVAALRDVTRGQLVPYTITLTNRLAVPLGALSVVDTFPAGFKYVSGSGRLDGQAVEPTVAGNRLTWANVQLLTNTQRTIQLMLIVGSGVSEGMYINRAQVFATQLASAASAEATAAVRVVADPTFDCSDLIGKVFDDVNQNGYQDQGEPGLAGVRLVSARGLVVTTDPHGRFHLTCAAIPDPDRGSNFILKLDDRSLPTGYRVTTENPRVERATRGKMIKFNFGAAIHRVVKLDLADGVYEPGTTEMRVQWKQRMALLLKELKQARSVLRLSYLAEVESQGLVKQRLDAAKREIEATWKREGGKYDLSVETEVFWRTGGPR